MSSTTLPDWRRNWTRADFRVSVTTPAAILGQILHRTIKNLHGRYLTHFRAGVTDWIPATDEVLEECQMVEEAKQAQGLPRLLPAQSERLHRMLSHFHTLEARTFYPRIRAAEVPLSWLWEDAPGGPLLLEGMVDVVLVEQATGPEAIALWDYKAGKHPGLGDPQLRAYERQMQPYALLYQRCYGTLPNQLALYFMGELNRKTPPTSRPPKALYELAPAALDEEGTFDWLRRTLELDERCRQLGQWDAPEADQAPQSLCRDCQVRYSCPSVGAPFVWDGRAEPVGADDADELDAFDL